MIIPKITAEVAANVLEVVDAGLSSGLGERIPGKMCVEAAVCYALDMPTHSDDPQCVNYMLRSFKIVMNDRSWSSNEARAKGLRRLAILQLGTLDNGFNEEEFARQMTQVFIKQWLPKVLRLQAEASWLPWARKETILDVVNKLEEGDERIQLVALKSVNHFQDDYYLAGCGDLEEGDYFWFDSSDLCANFSRSTQLLCKNRPNGEGKKAFDSALNDQMMAEFCEQAVQVLIEMKVPATPFLYLTEAPDASDSHSSES